MPADVLVTDPKVELAGRPVAQRNEPDCVEDTGQSKQAQSSKRNQSKRMTATASTIRGVNTSITGAGPAGGRIGTVGGFLRRDAFQGRKLRLLAYAALLVAGIYAAAAQERPAARPNAPMAFHIPSQPLATALQVYGQTTGIQLLYESSSAIGRTSVAVEGVFAPDAALAVLLTGTDLRVRYIRPDAITLALPDAETVASAAPSGPLDGADLSLGTLRVHGSSDNNEIARLNEYSRGVQVDIQNALRKNARTRDGSYRAVLDLWINPSHMIERTELFRSTGDPERDAAIATTLRGVTISRPAPASAPQPVRVGIIVQSLQ